MFELSPLGFLLILSYNNSHDIFSQWLCSLCAVLSRSVMSDPLQPTPCTAVCQAPLSMGILQARILEWVAMPSSRGSSQPKNWTQISCIAGRFFTNWATESEVAQLCLTLCDPIDCSPPWSSVHGIFQARILEWVAISFSRGTSRPRDQTRVSRIVGRCFTIWATREAQLSH